MTASLPPVPLLTVTDYQGPELRIQLSTLSRQVVAFHQALPEVNVYFAVKANPAPPVLKHLSLLGCGFEIASEGELHLLQGLGVSARHVLYSNPVKTPRSIVAARDWGIEWFTFDCREELDKLATLAPDGRYLMRLHSDGRHAIWPLSRKFGVPEVEARALIDHAAQQGLPLAGLTFHVGSQCIHADAWLDAIAQCADLLAHMRARGLATELLNLGGGFPCPIHPGIPSLAALAPPIRTALQSLPHELRFAAEPGRFIAGPAGTLTCQIIGISRREGQPWAYLDCGYYNGLMELNEPFGFTLRSPREGNLCDWTLAGPTCDAIDVIQRPYPLPENIQTGDLLEIPFMGAYSHCCANEFNGFHIPRLIIDDAAPCDSATPSDFSPRPQTT